MSLACVWNMYLVIDLILLLFCCPVDKVPATEDPVDMDKTNNSFIGLQKLNYVW